MVMIGQQKTTHLAHLRKWGQDAPKFHTKKGVRPLKLVFFFDPCKLMTWVWELCSWEVLEFPWQAWNGPNPFSLRVRMVCVYFFRGSMKETHGTSQIHFTFLGRSLFQSVSSIMAVDVFPTCFYYFKMCFHISLFEKYDRHQRTML